MANSTSNSPTINSFDKLYSMIPDFDKYNKTTYIQKTAIVFLVAAIASEILENSVVGKVPLYISGALVATKTLLVAGSYVQEKIWSGTSAAAQQNKDKKVWGILTPPTNSKITDVKISFNTGWNKLQDPITKKNPIDHSNETVMEELGQLMQDSLAIAGAVYDDLREWSQNKRFIRNGAPLQKGGLLIAQAWDHNINSNPWLYRGFFLLPIAYRAIFNLSNSNEWKAKFFESETPQNEWRMQYNKIMQEIITFAEEPNKIEDNRFYRWGSQHADNDYDFKESPDTMPT